MIKKVAFVLCVALSMFSCEASLAAQKHTMTQAAEAESSLAASVPQATQALVEFPIQLDGIELFHVSTSPVSALTPEMRAQLYQHNIQVFADGKVDTRALKVIPLPEGTGIGSDENMLMVISERDAAASGKTSTVLAGEVLGYIQSAVEAYRTKHAWKTYGLGSALTLLSIIGLWQALSWNNRLFVWLAHKAFQVHHRWKNGFHFRGVELLTARRIERIMLFILKIIRLVVILLCWYFFLPLILSFFPETRKLSEDIFHYLITPFVSIFTTIINYIPNLFYIFVICVIAYYVLKLIHFVFNLIEGGELKFDWFHDDWARPTYQIIRFLVIVTALISAYPYIPGSSSAAFQGVGLVLGAIISFASSSAISNIVAGVILTYTRAFRLNDRIKVGDTVGDVVEKTLLVTRIQTIKQVIVTIPNSLVMSAQIINYSTSAAEGGGVILHTSVTIGYDVPWQKVQELLIDAAMSTDKIEPQPSPFVLQTSLDDWYVSYEINAYTRAPHLMAVIYSDLHRNILDKFDAAGVEIMSPHYYAMRDGNASTVPSTLNANGYSSPAFKISNP